MKKRLFQLPWRSRRHIAADVDTELAFHIDARTEALIASGMDADAARTQALHEFGDVADARRYLTSLDREIEANRRRQDFMRDLIQDAVYAVRQLRNAPVFAITAMLTLAVGIGANTALLNLVNAVLLKPPAVRDAGTLAHVSPVERNGRYGQWTVPDYMAFREASRSFSGLVIHGGVDLVLGTDEPVRLSGQAVSANFFDVLGVRLALGRGFTAMDDSAGSPSVILSHETWVLQFSGDSSVVGRSIRLNQQPVTIVGVAPASFTGLRIWEDGDFWVPLAALPQLHARYRGIFSQGKSRWLRVVGRLAPSAELDDAQGEATLLQPRLEPHITNADERRSLSVTAVRGGMDPGSQARMLPVLSLLMLVPLLVLGVACANVANLFVSRSVQRQRELAVRRALGASRGRLVRQLLTECAILGVGAGALGVGVSWVLTTLVGATGQLPSDVMGMLSPDFRVLLLTLALALGAGVLFGLVPALAATGTSITPALKGDGTRGDGRSRHRLRNAFVVSQVALSLSLLITAGLFVGSLRKALLVEPGFDPGNTISLGFDLRGLGYDAAKASRFPAELRDRVAAAPGIERAAFADFLPLSGSSYTTNVARDDADADGRIASAHARVSNEYFATMRIALVAGRHFNDGDRATSPRVAVVNERLAAVLWPGENPVGKRIRVGGDSATSEVVGVARNGKYRRLSEGEQQPYFWLSAVQRPIGEQGVLVVRGSTSSDDAAQSARAALREIDPALPPFAITTLASSVAKTVEGQRAGAALLGVFGALALALASFGIFGVIAQGVAQRTREIGIRMSLGAQAGDVVRSFVREGLHLTLIGAAIGIGISLAASRLFSALLFGLQATDALTFVAASALLVLVAAIASLIPARRATLVDPLSALRAD
jgi:predicted permease